MCMSMAGTAKEKNVSITHLHVLGVFTFLARGKQNVEVNNCASAILDS